MAAPSVVVKSRLAGSATSPTASDAFCADAEPPAPAEDGELLDPAEQEARRTAAAAVATAGARREMGEIRDLTGSPFRWAIPLAIRSGRALV